MKAGINHVLVRPESDQDYLHQLLLTGDWEEQYRWTVFGEVLAVPERIFFKPHIPNLVDYNQVVTDYSIEYDTDMELKVGDRIMFRYIARADDEGVYEDASGKVLMMRYDMIYAKEVAGGWQPLNGWLLVKDDIVKYAGTPNRRYLLFPETSDGSIGVGCRVYSNRGVRVEVEEYNEELGVKRMQRKDVMMYEKNY